MIKDGVVIPVYNPGRYDSGSPCGSDVVLLATVRRPTSPFTRVARRARRIVSG